MRTQAPNNTLPPGMHDIKDLLEDILDRLDDLDQLKRTAVRTETRLCRLAMGLGQQRFLDLGPSHSDAANDNR